MATGDDAHRARFAAHNAFVGRSVHVRLRRDQTFVSGVLFGVDPESGDVALLLPATTPTDGAAIKIVMGHAIHSLTLDATMDGHTLDSIRVDVLAMDVEKLPNAKAASATSDDARQALAQQLRHFLDERFVPHTPSASGDEDAITVLGGAAILRFPFNINNIECTNEQILRRLQTLLETFQQI